MSSPLLPGLRRNTFSGDGIAPDRQPGEFRDTRGMDAFESLRRALGENFRDADDAHRGGISFYVRTATMVYTEPMFLALPSEPRLGILLVRCRKYHDEEVPVACGVAVHFVWDGASSRAKITSIEGLSPGTEQYIFNFLVVG